jgi:hypothetical protein
MSIIAENSGGAFTPILSPEGTHVAICVRMIHVGTSETEYKGQKKSQNKVRLYFELSNEKAVFKEENGEENFTVSKEYTLSMFEKANLRKDLESWRGKAFTTDEAASFDITKLLGVPCMVNIITKVHEPTGNKYTAITGISSIPKGLPKPERVNDLFEFSVSEFDQTKFNELTEYLQERVKASDEYQAIINPVAPVEEVFDSPEDDGVDDLPFIITLLLASSFLLQTLPF